MIYPSRLAVLAAAATAPPALLIGVFAPGQWFAGIVLVAFLVALILIDAAMGVRQVTLGFAGPRSVGVGAEFELEANVRFARAAPERCEIALAGHYLIEAPEGLRREVRLAGGAGAARLRFRALRRGSAALEAVWVRWRGLLGLTWHQRRLNIGEQVVIAPNIAAVRERSAQLLHRDMMHGLQARLQPGEGAEFEALTEFHPGMDKRAIDWKQSARHIQLLAKEYRAERNNNLIVALDCGRTMSEPLAGVPRIDRAVSAALLTAFAALKDGDRVSLFGFDSHPRVSTKPVSGQRSFALLQRVAAGLEYSDRETNYTLGLATMATGLTRRSLIVVFTEFADTVSAELMLSAVGTLLSRHLVLFVLLRDPELEAFTAAEPETADDVTKAVTAAALLGERKLVIARLKRLGVHVVEAAHDQAGPALLGAYVQLKRRNLL